MLSVRSVRNGRLRESCFSAPNHVHSDRPAAPLQFVRNRPWDSKKALFRYVPPALIEGAEFPSHEITGGAARVRTFWLPVSAVEAVSKVQPNDAGFLQDAAAFVKDPGECVNKTARRVFMPDLSINAIVPRPIIWRAGHDAVETVARQSRKDRAAVAIDYGYGHTLSPQKHPNIFGTFVSLSAIFRAFPSLT